MWFEPSLQTAAFCRSDVGTRTYTVLILSEVDICSLMPLEVGKYYICRHFGLEQVSTRRHTSVNVSPPSTAALYRHHKLPSLC
jgi:hypothetical protein